MTTIAAVLSLLGSNYRAFSDGEKILMIVDAQHYQDAIGTIERDSGEQWGDCGIEVYPEREIIRYRVKLRLKERWPIEQVKSDINEYYEAPAVLEIKEGVNWSPFQDWSGDRQQLGGIKDGETEYWILLELENTGDFVEYDVTNNLVDCFTETQTAVEVQEQP